MIETARSDRNDAVKELKRGLILAAARRVFEVEGLEAASVRAIAKEAGYTAGAIYFHFESKEAIHAAILTELLERLIGSVRRDVANAAGPADKFRCGSRAFFSFFADDPRDLDFGFYLFGRGIRPRGISKEIDTVLNDQLYQSLSPVVEAAQELGNSLNEARNLAATVFAHAVGLLLLKHTHRIRLFGASAHLLMDQFVERCLADLQGSKKVRRSKSK
jgi:AcrR family transcriptional regulator